jgi:ATP-binding protein involved in chromosome partitioning
MPYSENAALRALKNLTDPIGGKDIITAGLLGSLSYDKGTLTAVLQIDPSKAEAYARLQKRRRYRRR